MYYKVTKLVLTPTSSKPSTAAEVFISSPQIDQESLLGKFFFLCEIESTKPAALKIINFFVNALPSLYYQNEKISLKEKMGNINIAEIFESTLAKVNAEFEEFLKKERIKIESKKINITAGVIHKNNLVFTSIGTIKGFLIYNEDSKPQDEIGKKIYKIKNINDTEETGRKVNLNKIFSNVSEGKIPSESYVVFSNEILPEYINNKHFSKIITTLPSLSAIEQIKNQLHKTNSYVTFLAVVIKSSAKPHVKRSIPKMQLEVTAQNSLERMNTTEEETTKYLSPAGLVSSNKYTLWLKELPGRLFNRTRSTVSTSAIRDKIFMTQKNRWRLLKRFQYNAKNFFSIVVSIIIYFVKILAHPRELFAQIVNAVKKTYTTIIVSVLGTVRWFFNLSIISRIWLITFIICFSLFSYSLYHLGSSKKEQIAQANYHELVQDIKQKQNQIEASFLYNNDDKARELVKETEELLLDLAKFEDVDEKIASTLTANNQKYVDKLSKVVIINDPEELANFTKINANAQPNSITLINNNLIIADPATKSVYKQNIINKALDIILTDVTEIKYATASSNKNEVILAGSKGGIIIDEDIETSGIGEKFGDMDDINHYNNRLYILSTDRNNIIRYARNYSSYDNWIKEDFDLDDAVSLGIDGYVYVLKSNGELLQFLSGYNNKFDLNEVNPALSKTTKLRLTGEDSEEGFIYILEPSTNRIITFDKLGRFITQYKISNLNNIKDFAVDEENQKIYILNNTSVYNFDINNLE